jgi:hypothetical protein
MSHLVSMKSFILFMPRVKRTEREADHSPSSSADFNNALNYTFTPPIRLHDVVLS